MTQQKFPATHVLAYEQDGKMIEVLVIMEEHALLTVDDWAAGAVPDWTFEDDGRLYYCGVDFAAERGTCTLRPVGRRGGIPQDTLLAVVRQGRHSILDIARVFNCSLEEVSTSIAVLERLGKLERQGEDNVSPVWKGAVR